MVFSPINNLCSLKNNKSRLLCFDYGERNIGIAVSDPSWTITRALPIFDVKKNNVFHYVKNLIIQENVAGIVVGYPVHMNGDVGELCQKVHRFSQKLSHHINGIPIVKFDERMSSLVADQHMILDDVSRAKRKDKLDSIAACVILQGVLDHLRSHI
jgi:putative holliday junction resolvase